MTNAEALRTLADADAAAPDVLDAIAQLRGQAVALLAALPIREEDVEIVTAIGGKTPFPLTRDTTSFVVRLARAIYVRSEGVFPREEILDAVVRGEGTAAGARMLDLAVVNDQGEVLS